MMEERKKERSNRPTVSAKFAVGDLRFSEPVEQGTDLAENILGKDDRVSKPRGL